MLIWLLISCLVLFIYYDNQDGGRKCERLTKPVLLDVAKKLGVVGVKNRNKKEDICKALDKLEKGNSDCR